MSAVAQAIAALRGTGDGALLCEVVPYLRFMGLRLRVEQGVATGFMPFQPDLIGNHALPALHGGAIGGLLEATALTQVLCVSEQDQLPKVVDLTIDYLRTGRAVDTFARATITRAGRRIVSVRAEAWQDDPARPAATLQAHFLLRRWEPPPA